MINKIKSWLLTSNHLKHLIAGAGLLIVMLVLNLILGIPYFTSLIMTNVVVALCMATAEYKDKLHGGLFDCEDILAGMIVPMVVLIISFII